MHTLHLIHDSKHRHKHDGAPLDESDLQQVTPRTQEMNRNHRPLDWPPGEFFRDLPHEAIDEFESSSLHGCCESGSILIKEAQEPFSVFFLRAGSAKLSISSSDGRRLIVGSLGAGRILGLTSAVSGDPYELTAVAQSSCTVSSLQRTHFVEFLSRYPLASRNVARELCLENTRTYEQLRTIGLTSTASEKLARLLVGWCIPDKLKEGGARVRCVLTQCEIGEHIGLSRETVTRCLKKLKHKGLVKQNGSVIWIPSVSALAGYAGVDWTPGPHKPCA